MTDFIVYGNKTAKSAFVKTCSSKNCFNDRVSVYVEIDLPSHVYYKAFANLTELDLLKVETYSHRLKIAGSSKRRRKVNI